MRDDGDTSSTAAVACVPVAVHEAHVHHDDVGLHHRGPSSRRLDALGGRNHVETVLGQVACHGITPDRVVVDHHHPEQVVNCHVRSPAGR